MTRSLSQEKTRAQNKTVLLQSLFRDGASTRAELARQHGLSPVVVSDLVTELLVDGIVEDMGVRPNRGAGKPATLFSLRDSAFQIVAVSIADEERFVGVVTNLRGHVLHRAEAEVGTRDAEGARVLVADLVARLVEMATAPVLGVGIGTQGVVTNEQVVRVSSAFGWSNESLVDDVRRTYSGPVHLINDARAAALAVHTYRETPEDSLLLITLDRGVGAGLIIGGALVQGTHSLAGEIGHIVIDENGPRCPCGQNGCLDLVVSVPHLRRRMTESRSSAALESAARVLGRALAPMIAVTGVSDIYIAGAVDVVTSSFLHTVRETASTRVFGILADTVSVSAAPGGEDLVLLGAAATVLSAELGVS
ncbi:ROK family protein [Microbacterium nymphoidis]|uniref:ROK family protein n=1 Tax=Microbacterium nymphoidis TaxID=2898586 RepID=UPI001E46F306|nr:ROK family protein [Microbacterium nymphoidis]MCD2498473.1 ROK family protein [Microbacterium nymphoidis]